MKVTNPNPCLVNVRGESGKFIRIGPGAEADIGNANVERELRAGLLVKSGSKESDKEANAQAAATAPASVRGAATGNWGGTTKQADAKKSE